MVSNHKIDSKKSNSARNCKQRFNGRWLFSARVMAPTPFLNLQLHIVLYETNFIKSLMVVTLYWSRYSLIELGYKLDIICPTLIINLTCQKNIILLYNIQSSKVNSKFSFKILLTIETIKLSISGIEYLHSSQDDFIFS